MKSSENFFHHPLTQSFLLHFVLVSSMLVLTFKKSSQKEMVEVPIYTPAPKEVQKLTEVSKKPKVVLKSVNEQEATPKKAREVFGMKKSAYTDSTSGVLAKRGNTLAKEVDETKFTDDDVENLPVPTEEYLVSKMPSVLTEVRPTYPEEAKKNQLEGVVIIDILIDEQGIVRDAEVVEGEEIFREASLNAIKKFIFRPAEVDGKKVAVRIRYSLRFELEY